MEGNDNMRNITKNEIGSIAGGQIDPQVGMCIMTKLEVKAVVNEPMFDMHSASWALSKTCPMYFPSNHEAEMYIQDLMNFLPPMPPMP